MSDLWKELARQFFPVTPRDLGLKCCRSLGLPLFRADVVWVDLGDDDRSDDTHDEWRRLNEEAK